MRRDQPEKVVLVCKWNGQDDRFFGKYKCFESGKWRKIPGGVFPPEFKTREDALMFAAEWYAQEKIAHEARQRATKKPEELTWDAICDAYLTEVKGRMRGKASTRHEAITLTNASIRKGVLARVKPTEIDESLCLEWLRSVSSENIAAKGAPPRTRKPKTVRNIAKQLRYLFKVAIRRKLIPGMAFNPTMGDEFRDELKALMAWDQPREWFLPADDFKKLVTCPAIPNHRRIEYLTLGLTGLRPGELAGLQLRHLKTEGDVRYISVEQQFTEKRAKVGGGEIETLKTKWAGRNVPLHPALKDALDAWLKTGWEAWVGRAPQDDDYVIPNDAGAPYRRHDADVFRDDLVRAGCATKFNGEPLSPYSLRHLFSTLLQDAHAHDAAHDRLMGHRPKDTKTLNYSVKQLPFLAGEIERIVFELPNDAPSFGTAVEGANLTVAERCVPYAA
jgi:integrase